MDEEQSLEQLAEVLGKISEHPYDISLHAQHIRIAQELQDASQVSQAAEMMTTFLAAGDEAWLPRIDVLQASTKLDSVDSVEALLALYAQAEQDYLSLTILSKHLQLLLDQHALYHGEDAIPKPTELGDVFSSTWTRLQISDVVDKAKGHVMKSHELWDKQRDWLLSCLESASEAEKEDWVAYITSVFTARLNQPHMNNEETFQFYSSFVTNNKPASEYEAILVQASKPRARAAKSYDRLEQNEIRLRDTQYTLQGYSDLIATERRTNPEVYVTAAIYERAIAEAAKRRFAGETGAEEFLRVFWVTYLDRMRVRLEGAKMDPSELGELVSRAVRSVPGSGEVWARYIRYIEHVTPDPELITDTFSKALSSDLLQKDVEQLIPLYLARAGFERRLGESEEGPDPDSFARTMHLLEEGIELVRAANAAGDPTLRLEKYLAKLYRIASLPSKVCEVWKSATGFYKSSYIAWLAYTDALIEQDQFDEAREVFQSNQLKFVDWPEAIWDAWLLFENVHGNAQDLEAAMDKVEKFRAAVNAKRAKDAYQAMQQSAEQYAAPAQDPNTMQKQAQAQAATGTQMDVDVPVNERASVKRKSEDHEPPPASKKAKTDTTEPPKRDRENSTVFVGNLPLNPTKESLSRLFEDCGSIREIKISVVQRRHVATIEFADRDCVPAALTKDKKRIDEHEIEVHLAWKSTLYVTNFPEKTDDEEIRSIFDQYGTIFDVRWPSKKFKNTRRFCYVQFTSPASAQTALQLNGHELEPGKALNVYISNPERKKERSDADANDRELYVTGLSIYTTKDDLEQVFSTYGQVKEVRIALEPDGKAKGYAFIEFTEESAARAGLAANNHELKKRRIAVVTSDPRVRAKNRGFQSETGLGKNAEKRSRTLKVSNLPAETQEGLLQQAIEKVARVARVEVFHDTNEGVVEFENAADAGTLLLRQQPIVFQGQDLTFSQDSASGAGKVKEAAPPAPSARMFVPRKTTRPKPGLGHRTQGGSRPGGQPQASSSTAPEGGKGQDAFRQMLG